MPASASDEEIISCAAGEQRCVITQDLDFSALMALSGCRSPSNITLRLASARVDHVNDVLERALPQCVDDVTAGSLITIEDHGIRCRSLPLS
jgi:predicted nuclease of predicted toxin-antitoxin system